MKSKVKEIRYYNSEEKIKKQASLENKVVKLRNKKEKLDLKYESLLSKNANIKKLVKVSNKSFKTEIKVKRELNNLELLKENKLEKLSTYRTMKVWFSNLEYKKQRYTYGILFIVPWIIGMVLFFIPSFLTTIYWSFGDVSLIQGGVSSSFKGIGNFQYLFQSYVINNTQIFSVDVLNFVQNLLIDLPVIIIFSVIIAILLNKPFKGHTLIKAIFFIPVVFNFSVISSALSSGFGDVMDSSVAGNETFVQQLTDFFMKIGIGNSFMEIVVSSVTRIFTIVNLSGIQILIFIAAIQAVPKHLYEAAEVEGATKYESFWKITIPMITPMIITASVFTVVDSFSRAPIFRYLDSAMSQGNLGLAAAISVSYFVINIAIIGVVYLLFRGRVFYYDEK